MGSFTQKMGLATWDQPLDRYDYLQLANNWQIIDFHDHSPGRGVQISGTGIVPGSIQASNIATGAIGPTQLSAGVVSLTTRSGSSSLTANYGDLVIAGPGATITLPTASNNRVVGIVASTTVSGANPATVAGTNLWGLGLVGATSYKLGLPGAYTILESDGTNWYTIAGQQDTGWVSLNLQTGVTVGDGYTPVCRIAGNILKLRGTASCASLTAGSALFTLPSSSFQTNTPSFIKRLVTGNTTGPYVVRFQASNTFIYMDSACNDKIYMDGLEVPIYQNSGNA